MTPAGGPARKRTPREKGPYDAVTVVPLTSERFTDLEALFGPRGACGGCWCMWWRVSAKEFGETTAEEHREGLRRLVDAGRTPGLLAYAGGVPVGWCAVGPREDFPRLERSRVLKRVDDRPVWSIVCFFVAKTHRGRGVTSALVRGAIEHVRRHGGGTLEAYPVLPNKERMPDVFLFPGTPGPFLSAGFREVARRSETRPILRYDVQRQTGDEAA